VYLSVDIGINIAEKPTCFVPELVADSFLSSPVASLDAQSVDSLLSCEAYLCLAGFRYTVS